MNELTVQCQKYKQLLLPHLLKLLITQLHEDITHTISMPGVVILVNLSLSNVRMMSPLLSIW